MKFTMHQRECVNSRETDSKDTITIWNTLYTLSA